MLTPIEYKEKVGHALELLYTLGNDKCYQGMIQKDIQDVYENLDSVYMVLCEAQQKCEKDKTR